MHGLPVSTLPNARHCQRGYWDAIRGYYRALIDLERFLNRELVFVPDVSGDG